MPASFNTIISNSETKFSCAIEQFVHVIDTIVQELLGDADTPTASLGAGTA